MKFNQNGFTLVEGLLIIIALSLIVGVSYFVYSVQKDNNKNDTSNSKVKQDTPDSATTPSTIPDGWTEYKNQELGFSFAHPKDWGTVTVSPTTFEHTGKGYSVSFSGTDIKGMVASEDYGYTGPGRGGIYWEVNGSYSEMSKGVISSAEQAKTSSNYSTQLLSNDEKHVVSAYINCMDGGLVTQLLTNVGSTQISVFSLAKIQEGVPEGCPEKIPANTIDQKLGNDLKQLAGTVKVL